MNAQQPCPYPYIVTEPSDARRVVCIPSKNAPIHQDCFESRISLTSKTTSMKWHTVHLAGLLVIALNLIPIVRAQGDSPLNRLMSAPSVTLLDSLRPHLVHQLAAPASSATSIGRSASRFHSSGKRMIVAQVVHALSSDPDQEKTYAHAVEEALASYEQQAASGGLTNDIAGALALFIAAADLSYRGTEMTDAQSVTIAHQLQLGLDTPEMRAASDSSKQELYEFFATFGLCILVTRQIAVESHNESALANLKPLGGECLRWLLQVQPDAVTVNDNGLSVSPSAITAESTGAATSSSRVAISTAPPTPTGVPSIVGLWHGIGISSTFTTTPNASGTGVSSYGTTNRLRGRDVAFLANGWFTSVIPSTGLRGIDAAKASAESPYYWGRYTFDGRHGVINFVAGGPSTFEFVDGKIIYDKFEYTPRGPIK